MKVLVLGGTTEGAALCAALAAAGIGAVCSLAGRTAAPAALPVPVRVGGFGGPAGVAACLADGGFTHLVDATHPFAARMKPNAVAGAALAGVPLMALERPEWVPAAGDRWQVVPDMAAAAAALPAAPAAVFLAIGRQELAAFAGLPHRFLLRVVDAGPPPLPGADVVVARGPFTVEGDLALMRGHGVQVVVAKNAGGEGARAKLDAARTLGLPVVMVARPALPARPAVGSVAGVMRWLQGAERGV
jgi:precorrin-6A/cobalt-precorrin-6A reductase